MCFNSVFENILARRSLFGYFFWVQIVSLLAFLTVVSLFFIFPVYPGSWGSVYYSYGVHEYGGILIFLIFPLGAVAYIANWAVVENLVLFRFFSLLINWILISTFLCFASGDWMFFFLWFELVAVPVGFLVGVYGENPEKYRAVEYLWVYTLFGSTFFLAGVVSVWLFSGGDASLIASGLHCPPGVYFYFLFLFSILAKIPVWGIHSWLLKAHVEAPVAGSVLLAGVLLKIGVYGLIQFIASFPIPFWFSFTLSAWVLIGALSCIISVFRVVDLNTFIAYGSVAHMSLVVCGLLNGSLYGLTGALVIAIAHGFSSPALFVLANLYHDRFGTRNRLFLKGLNTFYPKLAWLWFIALVINLGGPFTLNFFGEYILYLAFARENPIFLGLLVLLSILTAISSIFLFSGLHLGPPPMMIGNGYYAKMLNPVLVREYSAVIFCLLPQIYFLFNFDVFVV